ncbi:MAG TPA: ABC transporter ATP-binding protein, partial [Opitutales bacterium]|nr:ABC transporter ATP-binding protein [Opitutales bacterium]
QRIGLAQALVHDPRLIILDEPTAGVDPVGSAEISELILKLKDQGKTVVLCSHLLSQVEDICDYVAILNRGKLILEGDVRDLVRRKGLQSFVVENLSEEGEKLVRKSVADAGATLVGVEQPQSSLSRVFLEHVSRAETSHKPEKTTDSKRGK